MPYISNSYVQSTDEILTRIKTSLDSTTDIIGYPITGALARWPGMEQATLPPDDKYWSQISIQGVVSQNTSFNQAGKRRITNHGLVFVQLFCPMSVIGSASVGRQLADRLLTNTFHARPVGVNVIFRNARVNDLAPDGKFYRFNIVSETQYDEIT